MKSILAFMTLVLSSSAFANGTGLRVEGCTAQIISLYKGDNSQSSSVALESFYVDGGLSHGRGTPMTRIPEAIRETYVGHRDLYSEDGTTLEIELSSGQDDLEVRAKIKKPSGNRFEVITTGSSRAQGTVFGTGIMKTILTLQNPLVASIHASDRSQENPMDDDLFPKHQTIFDNVMISCFATINEQ